MKIQHINQRLNFQIQTKKQQNSDKKIQKFISLYYCIDQLCYTDATQILNDIQDA